MTLQDFFREHPKVALGFSGGVDSAYLLWAARQWGADVRPYFIKSAFQPDFELEDARRLAGQLGADLQIIPVDILAVPGIAENPADRCYHCKRALFGRLQQAALEDGYEVLLDGTNASDQVADRPGMRALQELQVLSPLRLCGLTKDMVREASRQAGLFTWDKPAYACLATRIPTGCALSPQRLALAQEGERILHQLGFRDFRLRLLPLEQPGNVAACLEIRGDQLPMALEKREEIINKLQPLFDHVLLDLRHVRGN